MSIFRDKFYLLGFVIGNEQRQAMVYSQVLCSTSDLVSSLAHLFKFVCKLWQSGDTDWNRLRRNTSYLGFHKECGNFSVSSRMIVERTDR